MISDKDKRQYLGGSMTSEFWCFSFSYHAGLFKFLTLARLSFDCNYHLSPFCFIIYKINRKENFLDTP